MYRKIIVPIDLSDNEQAHHIIDIAEGMASKEDGTIYDEIIKAADKIGCDLIVMASHRPELKDYLFEPNAARGCTPCKSICFCSA